MAASISIISLSSFHASLLCLCLVIFFSENGAYARTKIAQDNHLQLIHTIQVSNLLPSADCKHSTKVDRSKASLEVVHRHGPCSPLNQNNANAPNSVQILLEDQSRVDSIHSTLSHRSDVKETDATKLPVNSGRSVGTGNYIVSIGFGSPKKDLPLIFDTGSDLTWARCTPNDTFDPTKSTSYANISCSSNMCSALTSATGNRPKCATSTCVYGVQYGDGSYSIGFLGKETLTVGSDIFENFYFGCGQRIEGLFGNAGGLLGLGRDKLSAVSQTASKYNKIFSYCIPSSSSTGFLSFGSPQSKSVKFTPLSGSSRSSFYDLDMTGITVGGKKLAIASSVFTTAGTIIDSGTVITRLPPEAYSALRSAFREAMAKYPMGQPLSLLDTCYDFSNYETVNVPTIVISFKGVDVNVDKEGIFFARAVNQVCLAFAGNSDASDTAIFGNTQQKNFEVVYDVSGGKVGFAAATCS